MGVPGSEFVWFPSTLGGAAAAANVKHGDGVAVGDRCGTRNMEERKHRHDQNSADTHQPGRGRCGRGKTHEPVASSARCVRQGEQPQDSRTRPCHQIGGGEAQAVAGEDQRRDQVPQPDAAIPGESARTPAQGRYSQCRVLTHQAGTPTQRKGKGKRAIK